MTCVTRLGTVTLLAIATAFAAPDIARAAGQFDGNWVLDAQGSGGRNIQTGGGQQVCSGFRVPFQIRDNQISGNFARSNANPTEIVASPRGSPMRGSVQPDGTFNLRWESYTVTGRITGNTMTATWNGQCGPRQATGTRVQ